MTNNRRNAFAVPIVLGAMLGVLRVPEAGAEAKGVVIELKGNVERKNADDTNWAPAIRGFLSPGARLKTGEDAHAVVILSDDRIFTVGSSSEAELAVEGDRVELKCIRGDVASGKKSSGGIVNWLYSRFTSSRTVGIGNQIASTRSGGAQDALLFPQDGKFVPSSISLRWRVPGDPPKCDVIVVCGDKEVLRKTGVEVNRVDLAGQLTPGVYEWFVGVPQGKRIGPCRLTVISDEQAKRVREQIDTETSAYRAEDTRALIAGMVYQKNGLVADAMSHYEKAVELSGGKDLLASRLLASIRRELGVE